MQVRGLEIINDALAYLGVLDPSETAQEDQLDQAERLGTARLERMSLEDKFIPGSITIDHELAPGEATYRIGPGAPAGPTSIETATTPYDIEAWSLIGGDGRERAISMGAAAPVPAVVRGPLQWQRRQQGTGMPHLLYVPRADSNERYREIHFAPTPGQAYTVRLYALVPAIMIIERLTQYSLDVGLYALLVSQVAASLLPVYATDPDQVQLVQAEADNSFAMWKRHSTPSRARVTRLSRRWTSSPSRGRTRYRRGFPGS